MAIISKTYGRILAILLAWLGFSCDQKEATKYGCGTSELKPQVTGTVVSKEGETPIQGIRVVLKDEYLGYDTVFTAKNGDFLLQHPSKTGGCENFFVELKDVDGDANGLFEDMEIPIASQNKQNLGTIRMIPIPIERPCEYGTPYATYKAKGIVVSQTDDAQIEGIRAVLKTRWDAESPFSGMDTVYTDNKGVFELKSRKPEFGFGRLYVELADVDGEENGLFADMDVEADYSNEKFTGGDGKWNMGEAEKDLGTIKMKTKE